MLRVFGFCYETNDYCSHFDRFFFEGKLQNLAEDGSFGFNSMAFED
jgi:hypothetical protein